MKGLRGLLSDVISTKSAESKTREIFKLMYCICMEVSKPFVQYLLAVSVSESKFKLKSKLSGKRELLVKIRMHNSNDPTLSSTEVNISSNPTNITVKIS